MANQLQANTCILFSLLVTQIIAHKEIHPNELVNFKESKIRMDATIVVSATPRQLAISGSWVNVTYQGVSDPNKQDIIAVYSPTSGKYKIDPVHQAPIKYVLASKSPKYLQTGVGSYRFRIINFRAPVYFAFLRYDGKTPVLSAVSNPVTFVNYNDPLQVHLALTGLPSEMVVVWSTLNASKPMVQWGTSPQSLVHSTSSSFSSYTSSDMCGSPAKDFGWRDPGLIHKAVMRDLQGGTTYYYKVGDGTYGWSEIFHFKTPPTDMSTVRVVAFGDMGLGQPDGSSQHWEEPPASNTSRLISKMVSKSEVDIVLHIGDISYAVGYSAQWDEFFDQVKDIAAYVPYMVCIGNHERDWPFSGGLFNVDDSGGECGVPHERRLVMPRSEPDKPWYGFDYGPVHFLLMSTEHDFKVGSPQYQFLEKDLMMVNRSKTPWLVFSGHRPMYVDSNDHTPVSGDNPVAKLMREELEPLLLKYKVDVAFWGHHHSYQRSCPLVKGKCQEGGITHVIIGMAGKGLSHLNLLKPSWVKHIDNKHYGLARFDANKASLTFEFVHDEDGAVHDSFILQRTNSI